MALEDPEAGGGLVPGLDVGGVQAPDADGGVVGRGHDRAGQDHQSGGKVFHFHLFFGVVRF